MSEAKHTKGDWRYSHAKGQAKKYVMCDGLRIATVPINSGKTDAKANAHIISAAPEMLQALLSIENDDGTIPEAIWELRNKAIAKALGEI